MAHILEGEASPSWSCRWKKHGAEPVDSINVVSEIWSHHRQEGSKRRHSNSNSDLIIMVLESAIFPETSRHGSSHGQHDSEERGFEAAHFRTTNHHKHLEKDLENSLKLSEVVEVHFKGRNIMVSTCFNLSVSQEDTTPCWTGLRLSHHMPGV